ncbi:MAG: TetR/AcrR family transcriptional regulator [Bacillota bacterium]
MGIKERKEREKDRRRELILNAAGEIVAEEGIDKLSIRKIAHRIEYSPAIIYHYFRDKDDILEHLLTRGYQKIVGGFKSVQEAAATPEQRIMGFARNYIHMALQNTQEYKNYLLNDAPRILDHTSVLFKGASRQRQAVGMLCQALKEVCRDKCPDDDRIELTAQIIWASIFGLIIRMIIEKDLPPEQKQNLIEHHINMVIDGMIPAGLANDRQRVK